MICWEHESILDFPVTNEIGKGNAAIHLSVIYLLLLVLPFRARNNVINIVYSFWAYGKFTQTIGTSSVCFFLKRLCVCVFQQNTFVNLFISERR